jgi:uroporphyrinogen decarboxylase
MNNLNSTASPNLLQQAIRRENLDRPPVWFMRQAGRYHSHYQNLRQNNSFMDVCKKPEVACEAALGPIEDFGFDAGILFSDLLFPLEVMGMGLKYDPAPELAWHIETPADAERLNSGKELASQLKFQADAIKLTKQRLPETTGFLGFVGGPLTLYCYAAEGSHKGELTSARRGLTDGRYEIFCAKLKDLLIENMVIQAEAGADTVAILDTCAGELNPDEYRQFVVPALSDVMQGFKARCPDTPITYYSKNTNAKHWESLTSLPIACMGIDWHHDIAEVLTDWNDQWAIQGNVDPDWLFLETNELVARISKIFTKVKALPASYRRGWICGLGHGVLPGTPEKNVRAFLKTQKEFFGEH